MFVNGFKGEFRTDELFPQVIFIALFVLLSLSAFIFSIVLFSKAMKQHNRIRSIVIITVTICIAVYYVGITCCGVYDAVDSIQYQREVAEENARKAEEAKKRNTPKYTDTTIYDLKKEIERYPSKYKTVSIEGYAGGCSKNKCYVSFPDPKTFNEYSDSAYRETSANSFVMLVYYQEQSSLPRILDGDYVVVTGVPVLKTSTNGNIYVYLDAASYTIVPDPN